MFLRLLFVLLIALNIAVGAWLLLGQPYARGGMPSDPGVAQLRLLSELPDTASSLAAPVAAASVSAANPEVAGEAGDSLSCLTLGPFATSQGLRQARDALAGHAARMRSRQEQLTQSRSWWVYLPAAGSRAQALEQARQLGAKRIDDYFVVSSSSSGGQPNTISLGLFKDQGNARKRRDEVAAAGFPAQVTERSETVPEYWLDVAVADLARFDWRSRIRNPDIGSHSASCF